MDPRRPSSSLASFGGYSVDGSMICQAALAEKTSIVEPGGPTDSLSAAAACRGRRVQLHSQQLGTAAVPTGGGLTKGQGSGLGQQIGPALWGPIKSFLKMLALEWSEKPLNSGEISRYKQQ